MPVRQHGSFHPGTGTGGAGEHWGGASFRFLPDVFTLRTHLTSETRSGQVARGPLDSGLGGHLRRSRTAATGKPSS